MRVVKQICKVEQNETNVNYNYYIHTYIYMHTLHWCTVVGIKKKNTSKICIGEVQFK